jgi:hypothetical protein
MTAATCSETFSRVGGGATVGAGAAVGGGTAALVCDCCCVTAEARSVGGGSADATRGTEGAATSAGELSAAFRVVSFAANGVGDVFSARLTTAGVWATDEALPPARDGAPREDDGAEEATGANGAAGATESCVTDGKTDAV